MARTPRILQIVWSRVTPTGSAYRRHVLVASLTSVGLSATGLITGPLLARSLGPSGRGDLAAVIAPVALLTWILALGLPTAAAYFVDTIPEKNLLATTTFFGIVVGAPVCALLWVLAPSYLSDHSSVTVTWARIFLLLMPFTAGAATALEVRRRLGPDARWNWWRSSPLLLPAVGTVGLAVAGSLTLGTALATYVVGALAPILHLAFRLAKDRPLALPRLGILRRLVPYAWRIAATVTTTSATNRLDQVVLATAVRPEQLGLYVVAVTVASATNPLGSGLSLALFGHLRGEPADGRSQARFRRSAIMAVVISSTVAIGLAIFAPVILRVVFGSQFEDATSTLRLLLPGAVAFDLLSVLGTKLYSDGRPGETSLAGLLGAVITIVGLLTLVPPFGIEGAAIVTSVAFSAEVVFLVARGVLGSAPAGKDGHESGDLTTGRPAE